MKARTEATLWMLPCIALACVGMAMLVVDTYRRAHSAIPNAPVAIVTPTPRTSPNAQTVGPPATAGGWDSGAWDGAPRETGCSASTLNASRRRGYQEGVRAGWEHGYRQGREDWRRR